VYNIIFTKIRTNVAGMGLVRPGLDLSTIFSSEDDDVNSASGSSTGGLGGAEAAEDGERLEVWQAAQRGRAEPGPGPTGWGGNVGHRWRRVARSTRALSGASSHCRPGHGVSVQGRGWSCGHAGSPRRSAITWKMAANSAPGSSGAGASPPGIAGDGDRNWEGEEGAMGSVVEGGCRGGEQNRAP
jgi:hypothetical protein